MGNGDLPPPRPDQHYNPPAGGQAVPGQRAVLRARTVIISGTGPSSGLYMYSPTPGLGNLIASITAAFTFGTDPFGNATVGGFTTYTLRSGTYYATQSTATGIISYSAASPAGPYALAGNLLAYIPELAQIHTNLAWIFTSTAPVTMQSPLQVSINQNANAIQITNLLSGHGTYMLELIDPAAGGHALAIQVSGDANQRFTIQASGQLSWGSGAAIADCQMQRLAAGILGTVGGTDFAVDTAGHGLQVKEGSNAKQGAATLAAGTVTVANTSVTSTSRIFLTAQDNSSTGALRISARVAGTSFTITSSNGADSGVVAWEIFEPAP